MEESKVEAEVVALRALGYRVAPASGARVVVTVSGSPAAAVLRPRDVLVGIDGHRVTGVDEAVTAIRRHRIGRRIRVTYLRGIAVRHASFKVVDSFLQPGKPSIGAVLSKAFRFPFEITIDTQTISGPSGGLVFALALADALSRDDLTRAHRVAATGTIDETGSIGDIGGVEEKVRAAKHSFADVFLVPAAEVSQARRVAGSIRIIGVRSLKGAIRALRALAPRRPT
jgi:Lon-like protease